MLTFRHPRRRSLINAWLLAGPFNPISVIAVLLSLLGIRDGGFGGLIMVGIILVVPCMIGAAFLVRALARRSNLSGGKVFGQAMKAYLLTVLVYSIVWALVYAIALGVDGNTDGISAALVIAPMGMIFGIVAGFIPALAGYFCIRRFTMEKNQVELVF